MNQMNMQFAIFSTFGGQVSWMQTVNTEEEALSICRERLEEIQPEEVIFAVPVIGFKQNI